MLKKAYVEITNRCNLACSFCPKTKREPRTMSAQEFGLVLSRLEGYVQYVYLHVMGEPLLHPELTTLFALAKAWDMKICITTNGTLLQKRSDELLAAESLHKISVSLHSFEGNDGADEQELSYLTQVWNFAEKAAKKRRHRRAAPLERWRRGRAQRRNSRLSALPHRRSLARDAKRQLSSARPPDLERAGKFDWPDLNAGESGAQFCYGLRDQLGVLVDGTVVPCCLDHEGDVALGNLFTQPLTEILTSPRACTLREGFSRRKPAEELCRRCGFAARFNK